MAAPRAFRCRLVVCLPARAFLDAVGACWRVEERTDKWRCLLSRAEVVDGALQLDGVQCTRGDMPIYG